MITVAETAPFQSKINKLLSQEERGDLIAYLSDPSAGTLIQGTGGIRKLRWSRGNRGKSGETADPLLETLK